MHRLPTWNMEGERGRRGKGGGGGAWQMNSASAKQMSAQAQTTIQKVSVLGVQPQPRSIVSAHCNGRMDTWTVKALQAATSRYRRRTMPNKLLGVLFARSPCFASGQAREAVQCDCVKGAACKDKQSLAHLGLLATSPAARLQPPLAALSWTVPAWPCQQKQPPRQRLQDNNLLYDPTSSNPIFLTQAPPCA